MEMVTSAHHHMRTLLLPLLAATLFPTLQAAEHGHGHSHAPKQGVVALDVYQDEARLHLLTAEIEGDATAPVLWHQSSTDGGRTWSKKGRVGEGQPAPQGATRGNDPQIAADGDKLIAIWMTRGTGLFESGPMATAVSSDGGKTWRAGRNPADDGTTGGHGFIDIIADRAGAFHVVWLDSRDGAQGLRHSFSKNAGETWEANQSIDTRTCECCWNTMARGPLGPYVLYRDKEPRDMRLAELNRAERGRVGEFNWNFEGCPHVGGALAVTSDGTVDRIHAAVWTGHENATGLYYLHTKADAWSPPLRIGGENAWHPAMAADEKGRLALAWDTKPEANAAEIWVMVSKDAGAGWDPPQKLTAPGVNASHPQVAATPDGFRVFWTQTAPGQSNVTWESAPVHLAE